MALLQSLCQWPIVRSNFFHVSFFFFWTGQEFDDDDYGDGDNHVFLNVLLDSGLLHVACCMRINNNNNNNIITKRTRARMSDLTMTLSVGRVVRLNIIMYRYRNRRVRSSTRSRYIVCTSEGWLLIITLLGT